MTPTTPRRDLRDPQVVEARLAARLAAALAERAQALPHDLSERLRVARDQAVLRARELRAAQAASRPAAGAAIVAAGRGTASLGVFGAPVPLWQRAASLLPLAMLVFGLVMVDRFSTQEQVAAAAEIDAMLLADDLPPDAYTDPGFAEYLRTPPPVSSELGRRTRALFAAGLIAALALAAGTAAAQVDRAPTWASLSPAQKQALGPLQQDWAGIDTARKQKWLDIAARFPRMPAEERERVQERMAAWAAMSPSERARARMQFQETRQLSADERRERWEAYRALPDDERDRLAEKAKPAPKPAAATTKSGSRSGSRAEGEGIVAGGKRNLVVPTTAPQGRPVAPTVVQARPGATTTTMATKAAPPAHHQPGLPKIVATPGFVDPATLLPKRGPQGAAVRSPNPPDPSRDP